MEPNCVSGIWPKLFYSSNCSPCSHRRWGQSQAQTSDLSVFPVGHAAAAPARGTCTENAPRRDFPPHFYPFINSYGTKTYIFLKKENKITFYVPMSLSRPYLHIYWYFHVCICLAFSHISHTFTSSLFLSITPSLISYWIFRLSPLWLFAVTIYSEHFHAYSFSIVLSITLKFVPGIPTFLS